MKKMSQILFFTSCIILLFSVNAAAYIDPGSASYIVQIIAGVLLTAGSALAIFWSKIKVALAKIFKKGNSTK